jgi:hypothetical protein
MGINSYNSNDEEKYSRIIGLLKSLPQVKAEDDFEFRLMTKIQNGNFETSSSKYKGRFPIWLFAPATAVVLSAIVFFIVSDFVQYDRNVPLFPEPVLREEAAANKTNITAKQYISKSAAGESANETSHVKVIVEPNDVVVTQHMQSPKFKPDKAVNLDEYISDKKSGRTESLKGPDVLVGRSTDPYFDFNGFYIGTGNSDSLRKIKARMDSVRKSAAKKRN